MNPEEDRSNSETEPETPAKEAPEPSSDDESQMEAWEDALKETDWGHQPC